MAVNANAPHGFSPVGTQLGVDLSMACHMYFIPSTDTNSYSIGDAVLSAANSDSSNPWGTFGIPAVTKAVGAPYSATVRGIVVGMFRDPFNLDQMFVPATKTKNYYVMVYDDPFAQFEIQCDSTAFSATTFPGNNAGFTAVASQSAPLNISTTVLAGGSVATTSTLPIRIIGVMQRPNVGTSGGFMPLLCTWNVHELKSVGTAGV